MTLAPIALIYMLVLATADDSEGQNLVAPVLRLLRAALNRAMRRAAPGPKNAGTLDCRF